MLDKLILGIMTSFFIFLTPAIPLVLLVGIFIIADTIMGLYKSWKLNEPIVSRKLARLITKFIAYTGSILLIYGLDVLILSDFINGDLLITKIGAAVLCFIEGFSMDEKLRLLNENRGVVYYVKSLLKTFKRFKEKVGEVIDIEINK